MSVRDEVYDLVDALPEDDPPAARRCLASLRPTRHHSLARFLASAPEDDEPSTPVQDRATAVAREVFRRGERISAAVKRTLPA